MVGSPLPSPTASRSNSREPLYRTTSLETRSRSPSPHPTPTPTPQHEYYGSANLTDRSRSPSPTSAIGAGPRGGPGGSGGGAGPAGKRHQRRLPATPQKPSSLNLPKRHDDRMPHVIPSPTIPQPHKSPGSINFPRLSASPTHLPNLNIQPGQQQQQQLGRLEHGVAGGGATAALGPPFPPPSGAVGGPRGPPPLYSPTERNDLNMPGSRHSSREQLASSSAGSRDRLDGGGGRGPGPPLAAPTRFSGPLLNNGRPDRGYTDRERDNRYRESRMEQQQLDNVGRGAGPRQQGPVPVMPNGYKPGQPTGRGERTNEPPRTGPPSRQPLPQQPQPPPPPPTQQPPPHSDSDDEEWC